MPFPIGRRMRLSGIWLAGPLMLVAVLLVALHVETARAQEPDGYVDLHVGMEASFKRHHGVIVTVTNHGTQDAFGVKAHLDIGDNAFCSSIPTSLEHVDSSTGIWNIGTLRAGRSTKLEFTYRLPDGATEDATVPLVVTVTSEEPEEPALLLHNNTATYWKWTPTSGSCQGGILQCRDGGVRRPALPGTGRGGHVHHRPGKPLGRP